MSTEVLCFFFHICCETTFHVSLLVAVFSAGILLITEERCVC